MSKKKNRAWFVCPQWGDLVSQHYASDTEAGRALKAHPKILAKLRAGTPVPKSTVLKTLQPLIEGTPTLRTYDVCSSTFHKLVAQAIA